MPNRNIVSISRCLTAVMLTTLGRVGMAQVTQRIDVGPNGIQGSGGGDMTAYGSCVSADGRYVVFQSGSPNLVSGDTNMTWDVFVRDRVAGNTERVSVDSAGGQANSSSGTDGICISPDGRFVAFESVASNLVAGDTNGAWDVFVRDRLTGITERVSVDSGGSQANDLSWRPAISADGRFIAFNSDATNLVAGDTNGRTDVFVRDRLLGTTVCTSLTPGGTVGSSQSEYPAISADGRFVSFDSLANDLVPGDTNNKLDVFVRDLLLSTTELVSISSTGTQGDGVSGVAALSADGRYVVYVSGATNLVAGDTNGLWDIFLRDRQLGITERVSVGPGGSQGAAYSYGPSITPDGRFVVFTTGTSYYVGDTAWVDIYVRDRVGDSTDLMSITSSGGMANGDSDGASISNDGRFVVFRSYASNLVPGDTNTFGDVFVRDRFATGFTSQCDPGVSSVIPCPCANPAAGVGRGCDNSSGTGGATLSASGVAYLSSDSLVFTTIGEKPTALSILLQGDTFLPNGIVFGQGVRCAGGALKRLYSKTASAGSITAPDLAAGDPGVSARSATLGVPIQPGQPYTYLVYYRDPIVLGGCSAASTFNATQTGVVSWFP